MSKKPYFWLKLHCYIKLGISVHRFSGRVRYYNQREVGLKGFLLAVKSVKCSNSKVKFLRFQSVVPAPER